MSRSRRPLVTLALACAACGMAGSALADPIADVTDFRVGLHPAFTRFVVELNRTASYEVSFSQGPGEGETLIVRIPAGCQAQSMVYPRGHIQRLQVSDDPSGGGCVARLQLRNRHLSISEMMLQRPPRVVLDISTSG